MLLIWRKSIFFHNKISFLYANVILEMFSWNSVIEKKNPFKLRYIYINSAILSSTTSFFLEYANLVYISFSY